MNTVFSKIKIKYPWGYESLSAHVAFYSAPKSKFYQFAYDGENWFGQPSSKDYFVKLPLFEVPEEVQKGFPEVKAKVKIEAPKTQGDYTLETVKALFEENRCKLLATEYVNQKTKMPYVCKCGRESVTTLSVFRKSLRCPKCSDENLITLDKEIRRKKAHFGKAFNYYLLKPHRLRRDKTV